jgi:glycosyltransferase involved in cell wall biosynthesis
MELLKTLKLSNVIRCFTPRPKNIKYKFQEIIYVPTLNIRFSRILFQMPLALYLIYYCIKTRPDVIYTRHTGFTVSPLIVSRLFKIPYIIEEDDAIVELMKMTKASGLGIEIVKLSERLNYKYAGKIIAVTPGIKDYIKDKHNIPDEKIIVIENGANIELFKPKDQKKSIKKLKLNRANHYICIVCSLNPWHGVEYLIQSAPLILKEHPNTKFLIVGEGKIKEKLVNLAAKTGVTDKFIFTGAVPYEEVPRYINASDVCVAPFVRARNERIGLSPLKIYEYAACGKPIVVSRIPNLEFVEEQKAGILVAPENPEELAEAIIKVLKDEKLREEMGRNGRGYVAKNHTWESVARKVVEVCEDAVAEYKK